VLVGDRRICWGMLRNSKEVLVITAILPVASERWTYLTSKEKDR